MNQEQTFQNAVSAINYAVSAGYLTDKKEVSLVKDSDGKSVLFMFVLPTNNIYYSLRFGPSQQYKAVPDKDLWTSIMTAYYVQLINSVLKPVLVNMQVNNLTFSQYANIFNQMNKDPMYPPVIPADYAKDVFYLTQKFLKFSQINPDFARSMGQHSDKYYFAKMQKQMNKEIDFANSKSEKEEYSKIKHTIEQAGAFFAMLLRATDLFLESNTLITDNCNYNQIMRQIQTVKVDIPDKPTDGNGFSRFSM